MAKSPSTPGALEKVLKDTLSGMKSSLPPTVTTLVVDGASMTAPAVTAKLQGYVDTFQAVHDARAVFNNAVATRTNLEPDVHAFIINLHASLTVLLGSKSPLLAKMGKAPTKARQAPSAATKAEAAKKTAATKQARGEVGKKKRAKIKAPPPPKA